MTVSGLTGKRNILNYSKKIAVFTFLIKYFETLHRNILLYSHGGVQENLCASTFDRLNCHVEGQVGFATVAIKAVKIRTLTLKIHISLLNTVRVLKEAYF